jgi:hypothetical protein
LDIVQATLQDIVVRYGIAILEDPRRTRALLLDLCGGHRGEINVLDMALRSGVVADVQDASPAIPRAVLVARLAGRLQDTYLLPEDAARWAVAAVATTVASAHDAAADRVLVSDLRATISVRRGEDPEGFWRQIGATPGRVRIPGDVEVKVNARLTASDLEQFARDLRDASPLHYVDLSYSSVSPAAIRLLAGVGGLLGLDLSRTDIDVAGVAALGSCAELRDLSLWGCTRVSDASLSHLGEIDELRRLELGRCQRLSPAAPAKLGRLQSLEYLGLADTRIDDSGLWGLHSLSALRHLDVSGTRVTGSGLGGLTRLRRLELLNLHGTVALRPDHLGALRSLSRLTWLDLGRCGLITDAALATVRGLASLTHLGLEALALTDAGMLYVKDLVALNSLVLSWTQVGNVGLERLQPLVGLRHLGLSGTRVSDSGLASLRAFRDLQQLDLSNTLVTDEGLEHLCDHPSLTVLDLENTAISDAGLALLSGLAKLTTLFLSRTAVTDEGLLALCDSGHLTSIDISQCPAVTDVCVGELESRGVTVTREMAV